MSSIYSSELYMSDIRTAFLNTINSQKLQGKSVVITGATGLIGSFIVDMLMYANETLNYKINVYAVGRNIGRLQDRFVVYINNIYFHAIEQNVNDMVHFSFHADYIIHAAGNSYPAVFKQDPVGTITSNIYGTHNLLNYAKETNAEKFLFVSSGEIYGQHNYDACKENDSGYVNPMEVRSCYPASKRAAENLCVAYAEQYGIDVSVVRPCHIYGPNVTSSDNRASVQFINNALNHENIVLKSAGQQFRSYCYIADCGSAILTVLLLETTKEVYNIANSKARVTIAEFAQIVAEQVGQEVILDTATDTKNDTPIKKAVLDSSKLENLGWSGQFDIHKGIQHTLKILQYISGKE